MSGRGRNRNVTSLPNYNHQAISQNISLEDYLGENIADNSGTPTNSFSTDASDEDDFGIKISGLSSSSSLSWSEEYESELGKKVQSELEKLDRIVQGTEINPLPYDVDQINEWKFFFPSLYILGQHTPTNSVENSEASSEEELFTRKHQKYHNGLIKCKNICEGDLPNPSRNYHSLPRKPRSLEIDNYMKISSIKSSDLRHRKTNQKPTFTKQKSGDMGDNTSPDYMSLPFLIATPIKAQQRQGFNKNKTLRTVILPPIENSFRSISATPRKASTKNLFRPLDYHRNRSMKDSDCANSMLKDSLLKIFDHIPLSNR